MGKRLLTARLIPTVSLATPQYILIYSQPSAFDASSTDYCAACCTDVKEEKLTGTLMSDQSKQPITEVFGSAFLQQVYTQGPLNSNLDSELITANKPP